MWPPPRSLLGPALFAAIPLVASADLLSGAGFSFSAVYAAFTGLIAWHFGWPAGLVAAFVAWSGWSIVDRIDSPSLDTLGLVWTAGQRLAGLVGLAYVLAALRRSDERLRQLLAQRDEILASQTREPATLSGNVLRR